MTAYHDLNRNQIVGFFEKGDKYTRSLGFELEHILLHTSTGAAVTYSQPGGVRDVLRRLAPFYDEEIYDEGDIIGLARAGETLTIEPAGQLEISAGPFARVADIERAYRAFREHLDPILEEFGLETALLGYNPSSKASDLELIPKYRYDCMTKFLGAQAYESICMMRGTASLQISIDFRNEADALRKLRIAEVIAPILALICDNSPIFEGEKRKRQLVRTGVWAGMNQDRVGTVPGSLSPDFTFAGYADYILSREAVLVPGEAAEEGWRYVGARTFDEIYADRAMTQREIEHALSMVWPDARLKNFVEIRPADAMPIEYCLAYSALVSAVFYNDCNLDALDELLEGVGEAEVRAAKEALMDAGYAAEVYGRPAAFWADTLVQLAQETLDQDELPHLEPLESLVARRRTLADDA